MKPFLPCLCLSVSFLLLLHGIHGLNYVEKFCRKAVRGDTQLNYKFCVKALQVASENNTRNLQRLGLITLGLIKTNLTHTMSHVNHLLNLNDKSSKKKFDESALIDCISIYSDASNALEEAVKDFRSKDYNDANVEISAVTDAPTTCEDGFFERHSVSPLTRMNSDLYQLGIIALIITNIIQS